MHFNFTNRRLYVFFLALSFLTACNNISKKNIKTITETYYKKDNNLLTPTESSTKELVFIRPYYQLFMPDDYSFPFFNRSGAKIIYYFQDNKLISCDIYNSSGKDYNLQYRYLDNGKLSAILENDAVIYQFEYLKDKIIFKNLEKGEMLNAEIFLKDKIVTRMVDMKNGEHIYSFDKKNNTIKEAAIAKKAELFYIYNDNDELLSLTAFDYLGKEVGAATISYEYDEYGNWIEKTVSMTDKYNTEYPEYVIKREIIYE